MKNKTDDLFEHLEYYYGRKRRQPYKPSYFCYCLYLYCKRCNQLDKLFGKNIRSRL